MGIISFEHDGNFDSVSRFLTRVKKMQFDKILQKFGEEGVKALSEATPTDTGKTASSWYYETHYAPTYCSITWNNSNTSDGIPIAVLIQYGHGTRNGGYVRGRDYINPAMKPVFDKIANEVWKEVTK